MDFKTKSFILNVPWFILPFVSSKILLKRYIKIIDTTAPVIKLKGTSVVSIITGNTYTEQGATASDKTDGDITNKIITSGMVNTSRAGTYKVTYTVTNSNNKTTTVVRTVVVEEKATTGENNSDTNSNTTETNANVVENNNNAGGNT